MVESDSQVALSWVKRSEDCPWSMRFFSDKLHNCLAALHQVEFVHVNREMNSFADALAKSGVNMEGQRIWWPMD